MYTYIRTGPFAFWVECLPIGLGDQGSMLRQIIPKNQKMVLDTSLLNTQHYKVHVKGKMEQSPTSQYCSY